MINGQLTTLLDLGTGRNKINKSRSARALNETINLNKTVKLDKLIDKKIEAGP